MKLIIDTTQFDNFMDEAEDFFSIDLMYDIGNEIVNFFKDSFRNQGFTDVNLKPWKKVDGKTKAMIETGKLRNSIRIKKIDTRLVEVISDMPYSTIQNDGGTIIITEKMKKFFWAKYKKTGSPKWKAMALSTKINIPKRQFMGESVALNKIIQATIEEEYNRIT